MIQLTTSGNVCKNHVDIKCSTLNTTHYAMTFKTSLYLCLEVIIQRDFVARSNEIVNLKQEDIFLIFKNKQLVGNDNTKL